MKKIGILTSGGDAPGMNAAIRAVVRAAAHNGIETVGIQHGYAGLLGREFMPLQALTVSKIIHDAGTALRTSRSAAFATAQGLQEAVTICKEEGLEGLVTIGGDGTFRGARDLSLAGIPCVAIPATIDNDIVCSDYSIGFDTAINTVRDAVEKISSTVFSHDRCFLVEVMGHNAGDIAMHVGIACGAIAVLVPEIPFDFSALIARILQSKSNGKYNYLIVVAEGVTKTKHSDRLSIFEMAEKIERETGINTRADILGYVQRGGTPTTKERVVASEMGYHAVELLKNGIGNRVIAVKDNRMTDLDIVQALAMKKPFHHKLYEIANMLSL